MLTWKICRQGARPCAALGIAVLLLGRIGHTVEFAPVVLRQGPLAVTIDPRNGGLAEIRYGGELLGREAQDIPPLDLREEKKWVVGEGVAKLQGVELQQPDAQTAVATLRAGDWQIAVRYEMDTQWPMLSRSAKVTWLGREPTKLKGFWLGSPAFTTGKESYYYSPGSYPPKRFAADTPRAGTTHTFGQSIAPLVMQLTARRTLLWLFDELTPASDRGSATVTEMDVALRVSQAFQAMARMQKGDTQEIGTACLWLLESDGEAALLRIHDWMRRRGHTVPADRPDWFRDAVLYSFHPGGTIGGQFRDLGGFTAARGLLDHIAALGANAIWIMPIEDASVYSPRDYYKFQPGLGTAEEYRALVDRAHQLGLHVLQDCVPHGGRNDYPRAKEHPEWLAYEEDGSTLPYWCYDFNWPTWRHYMAGVARHYVTKFDVDGYRVDAVGGSRIPNWNPKIPYARASHAQLQGGLNMLRSLRSAVKQSKPREGGLLAEVQGSVYGTVSDAVYDFTGCYQAFQDVRKLPAEQYVPRLRRWLHEQQYAETPDLLRLRHIESHDSLRAELWYGIQPMRAMMALSAWIHGMPLVYHEMENGHETAFQRIFAIRRQLAELHRGTADYLGVETPPAVFACLRNDGRHASVVLINLADEPLDFAAAVPIALLPRDARGKPSVAVVRPSDAHELPTSVSQGKLMLPLRLGPFEYVVCPVRTSEAEVAQSVLTFRGNSSYESRPLLAELLPSIDARTGLLDGLSSADHEPLIGPVDLYLPASYGREFTAATHETLGKESVWRCPLGQSTWEVRYLTETDGLHLRTKWTGEKPQGAALYLPFPQAKSWGALTAEGALDGSYAPRHLPIESTASSIYWRPQGTNVLFDSLLHPLRESALQQPLTAWTPKPLYIGFGNRTPPARVQWLDHLGDKKQLGLLVTWNDAQTPAGPQCKELDLRISRIRDAEEESVRSTAKPLAVRATAGGWDYENAHYRLRLGRSGMITELVAKKPTPHTILSGADLYTDNGFHAERNRFAASNDVEAAARIWHDEKGLLRLRFEGRLRGFQRFDLLNPPIEYFAEYTLGSSASLRVSHGVRPQAGPTDKGGFLALMSPTPDIRRAIFKSAGQVVYDGASQQRGRTGQTRAMKPPVVPDEIELRGDHDSLVRLTGLSCGAIPLTNVFMQGQNFFLAWFDGPVPQAYDREWRWTSAVWTVGDAVSEAIGDPPVAIQAAEKQELLEDAGFEQGRKGRPVSLRTGAPLPGGAAESAWQAPYGGRIVFSPTHGGRAAAEVTNPSGDYALWRQSVALAALTPGKRLRLSAWVKGDLIRRGDVGWKVGMVRFAVVADQTRYVSSPPLVGTFDWKKTNVELVVPPKLKALRVEIGLNGATGTLWIDDVELVAESLDRP